ncbi:MAG TPA: T9SS type A sorting domain-containing protein [Balneolales bacterium]|nr:T9SS type A sorting domain-containing protein [Balneolales bacterium]
MSKNILSTILFVLLPVSFLFAQSSSDPLHWTAPVKVKSDNIFMLWGQQNTSGARISNQKIYRYNLSNNKLSADQRLSATQDHQDPNANLSGNQQMDAASGYFTNSLFENVVAAWEGPNQSIQIMIPHFDSTANAWSQSSELTIPGPVVANSGGQKGRIYVRTGDFLGNGRDQFVVAYEGSDSKIHLMVYSVDDNLTPHLIASIADESLTSSQSQYDRFSITTGDLNGNGKDEIILDGIGQNGGWDIYSKVYEVSGSSIIPEARTVVFREPSNYNIQAPEFGITSGQFKMDGEDQVALVCAANQYDGNNAYVFTYMLEASKDLSSLTYDPTKRDSIEIGTSGSITDFSISSGDLNNDGRAELVYDLNDAIHVYSTDDNLNLTYHQTLSGLSGGADDYELSYDFMKVGDLNEDGSSNIVVEKDMYGNGTNHWLEVAAYGISQDLSSHSLLATVQTDTTTDSGFGSYYHYALALGTFNGANFTLGAPRHFVRNDVVQPLVVLNTPPIHFDMLNGTKYDLSDCFSGNGCTFNSTYEQQSQSTINLETQTHNDVSDAAGVDLSGNISVTATLSAEFLGAGAQVSVGVATNFEEKVEKTWGSSFSNDNTTSYTTKLDIGVSAEGDDQIYATTSSYDIWAYPVYGGNNPTPIDYINFTSPISTLGSWFPSKTYATNNYVPNHEVGNILSYLPSKEAISNPDIDSSIVSVPQSQGLPISGQSGSYWDLNYSKYTQSTLSSTWNSGWDTNIDMGAAYSSTGDNSHMNTTTTTISNGFDLRATFGSLVDSLGSEAAYTVYPYAFRSKEGAIVIDYAVDPVTGGSGSPSWWQKEYGNEPDPTFILPWFYDPQKGITLSENAKRYQTTDIFYDNSNPSPGDTLTISARIRNFSLAGTLKPVSVRFYLGDPNNGGIPIVDTNGDTVITTANTIGARSYADVHFHWKVPPTVPGTLLYSGNTVRIYGVIDPNNQITEVHENNNMGWSALEVSGITTAIQKDPDGNQLPTSVKLYPNYPNPFNPTTTIHYALPASGNVRLTVYNILGRKIAQLVDGRQTAGNHDIRFNASQLSSGVYFYRLQVNNFVRTGKMMLIK